MPIRPARRRPRTKTSTESTTSPLAPEVAAALRLADLRQSEQTMLWVRGFAVVFSALQVLSRTADDPAVIGIGLGISATLVVGNLLAWLIHRRVATVRGATALAVATLALDVAASSGYVWLYTFDQASALWAVLFIVPLEGARRFRLRGALLTWLAVAVLYALRELWGSQRYGYPLEWNSITFRMGINLLIALVAGLMARDLVRERLSVEAAYRELARVDALRQRLVATLAHDVRSPLGAIRGCLQTVLARPQLDPAKARKLLEAADGQARRLEYLASDLLDLARVSHGALELDREPLKVRPLVERAVAAAGAGGAFAIAVEPDLVVDADERRLEQVLVNLVTNALRHGREPYEVRGEDDGSAVVLTVTDGGAGIPADRLPALFEPFGATGKSKDSVGLGLWIIRMLVEAHGGRVWYRSQRPGAQFGIELPKV